MKEQNKVTLTENDISVEYNDIKDKSLYDGGGTRSLFDGGGTRSLFDGGGTRSLTDGGGT